MRATKTWVPVIAALVALAAAAGCSIPAPSSAPSPPPPSDACVSTRNLSPETPLTSTPAATAFSASAVPLSSFMRTGADTITGQQTILDFPTPTQVVAPDQAVVLASFTVNTTDPNGWQLSRSFDAVTFWTVDGVQLSQQSCPDHTGAVLAAMRAAGHEPLPERIEAGHTATGWVAFVVPRSSTAINLWMRHLDPDGGYAGAEASLLHITPR